MDKKNTKTVKITVNGEAKEINTSAFLIDVLKSLDVGQLDFGVAASINGTIVPKQQWPSLKLQSDDSVEIVRAFQGG